MMKGLFTGIIGILNALLFFSLYKNSGWHSLLPALFTMSIAGVMSICAFVGLLRSLQEEKYKAAAGWSVSLLLAAIPFVWMVFSDQISRYWSPGRT